MGPTSEAASYYYLAEEKGWLTAGTGKDSNIKDRTFLEEFARDSFENLLFSICRFKEVIFDFLHRLWDISSPRTFWDIYFVFQYTFFL